jgi:hypothetical protein
VGECLLESGNTTDVFPGKVLENGLAAKIPAKRNGGQSRWLKKNSAKMSYPL